MQAITESQAEAGQVIDATPEELIDECNSLGQLKSLDGMVVDQTDIGEGRVREQRMRVISEGSEIAWIEPGDTIVTRDNRQSTIEAIGGDISDAPGMHIYEQRESGESAVHLTLIQRWCDKGRQVIVGTRTAEFANVETKE